MHQHPRNGVQALEEAWAKIHALVTEVLHGERPRALDGEDQASE
jgi:hypothetical protein